MTVLESHVGVNEQDKYQNCVCGWAEGTSSEWSNRQRDQCNRQSSLECPVVASMDWACMRYGGRIIDATIDHLWTWGHDLLLCRCREGSEAWDRG